MLVLGLETSCDETAAAVVLREADGRGKIQRIFTMQPCRRDPCRIYDPRVAYRSVLEVNAGSFRRWRVRPGDRITVRATPAG